VSRRNTSLEIAESFEDDFTVSLEPDLPELFEGPDVLAGQSGRLIAVFVPKSHERRRPEQLRTRLVLSRLALPDHAQCLLAVEDAYDISQLESLSHDFHAIVNVEDRSALRRLRTKSLEHRKIPEATRRMVEWRSTFLMTVSLAHQPKLFARDEDLFDGPDVYDNEPVLPGQPGNGHAASSLVPMWAGHLLTQSELPLVRSVNVRVRDGALVGGEAVTGRSVRERIRPYLALAAETAFRIDNGVPYLGRPTAGVFVVQGARSFREDPLKPLRASAFAGWALLEDPSESEFSQSVRQTAEWLRGTVGERA
jgi:hypothetical protein